MAKKISRPIIYTALGAAVAGAVVFLTQPDAPAAHKKVKHTSVIVQTADGFTDADYTAHFARYAGGARDAFAAVVTPVKPVVKVVSKPIKPAIDKGSWELTGVNTIDGVASAVVENRATGDVAFLKNGDTWHSLRVVKVAPETLVLENEIGQQTKLAFKTDEPDTTLPANVAAVPGAPPLPLMSQNFAAGPQGYPGGQPGAFGGQQNLAAGQPGAQDQLVPMPIQPLPGLDASPGGGRRRRRQQN